MQKRTLAPAAVLLAGGLGGLALRKWEHLSAFEADTGLPIPGAPATLALIALSAAVLLVLALLCRGAGRGLQGGYDQAMDLPAPLRSQAVTGMVLGGFLMLGAGALLLAGLAGRYLAGEAVGLAGLLVLAREGLLAVLVLSSGASVLLLGKNNYRREGRGERSACLLAPAYTACVWLIVTYLDHSGDPIVLDYVYQLFAVVASVLGSYFLAGFGFQRPKGFPAAFFSLAAIYFCLVALGAWGGLPEVLLSGGYALYFAASAAALFHDAPRPLGPRMPGGKRLAHTETLLDQEETSDEG